MEVGTRPLTSQEKRWSYGIWGGWLALFLFLEIAGFKSKRAPWRTLSETTWSVQSPTRFRAIKLLTYGGLSILRRHIDEPYWPSRPPKDPSAYS